MKRKQLLQKIYWVSAFLAVSILLYLISIIFLNPSSVGNPQFGRNINLWAVIWTANFIILFVLGFILARDLIKLLFEFQQGESGSRIKAKLVGSFIIISLFPALIMSFLALGLINRTLDQWFKSPSRQLLESARQMEENFYDMHRGVALRRLLEHRPQGASITPQQARELLSGDAAPEGFRGLLLLDAQGQVLDRAGNWATPQLPEEALETVREGLSQVTAEGQYYFRRKSEPQDPGLGDSATHDYGFAGVPLMTPDGQLRGALMARFILTDSTQFHRMGIEEAFSAQQLIEQDERTLRLTYFSVIGVTTLAVIFGFVWLATYIARRITYPIEALAQGSRQLAEGNLDHRVEVEAVDELGVLVESFNRMAGDIRQSRSELEKANAELVASNREIDKRRRYIETIVQNIATGVVSIDRMHVVRSVNEAALKMFGKERQEVIDRKVEDFSDPAFYQEFLNLARRAQLYGTYRRELTIRLDERKRHIAATMTLSRAPESEEMEFLVVLDDLTELIRAEKFAAWQEVARRMAHEIKNPLTPIQLQAQRVERRFRRLEAQLNETDSQESPGRDRAGDRPPGRQGATSPLAPPSPSTSPLSTFPSTAQPAAGATSQPRRPSGGQADHREHRGQARPAVSTSELQQFGKVVREATEIIVSEAEILRQLIQEFSRFARLPSHKPSQVEVHKVIERALNLYNGRLQGVEVEKRFDPNLETAQADPQQLERVLVNLIDNSLDSLAEMNGDRRLWILTRLHPKRRSWLLKISDNGSGIPGEDYDHLFLPYFSTKKKGTGLGLAIVRQIIEEHGGSIKAEPNRPHGVTFTLEFPLGEA
ncbi:MAG TPA: ATP-binding protein [Acidobacteriota bacterium]|nr:ATP-binding protein [Acidobacteriota bacterium]